MSKVRSCSKVKRKLYNLVSSLTGNIKHNIIPEKSDDLPNKFIDFFLNKIKKIKTNLDIHPMYDPPKRDLQCELDTFIEMTQEEVHSIVMKTSTMYCNSDPFPTNLIKFNLDILMSIITNLVNNLNFI